MNDMDEALLPGEDLIKRGVDDLNRGEDTEFSLLALIAGPRLRRLGFQIPSRENSIQPLEHQLYERLEARLSGEAYSRYNSLLRRIASYASAVEREHSRG